MSIERVNKNDLVVVIAELADAIKHANRFDEDLQQAYHLRCARESATEAVRVLGELLGKMEEGR